MIHSLVQADSHRVLSLKNGGFLCDSEAYSPFSQLRAVNLPDNLRAAHNPTAPATTLIGQ